MIAVFLNESWWSYFKADIAGLILLIQKLNMAENIWANVPQSWYARVVFIMSHCSFLIRRPFIWFYIFMFNSIQNTTTHINACLKLMIWMREKENIVQAWKFQTLIVLNYLIENLHNNLSSHFLSSPHSLYLPLHPIPFSPPSFFPFSSILFPLIRKQTSF